MSARRLIESGDEEADISAPDDDAASGQTSVRCSAGRARKKPKSEARAERGDESRTPAGAGPGATSGCGGC